MSRIKKCSRCLKYLPLDDFYRDKRTKDGVMGCCKKCHNGRLVKQRQENARSRNNQRLGSKRYRDRHTVKVRKNDRKYYHEGGGKEKDRKWKKENRNRVYASLKKSEKKNVLKVKARKAVREAVRRKEIKKPSCCHECGKVVDRLSAHHHMGYTKRYWLDVVWLCGLCHGKTHRK